MWVSVVNSRHTSHCVMWEQCEEPVVYEDQESGAEEQDLQPIFVGSQLYYSAHEIVPLLQKCSRMSDQNTLLRDQTANLQTQLHEKLRRCEFLEQENARISKLYCAADERLIALTVQYDQAKALREEAGHVSMKPSAQVPWP